MTAISELLDKATASGRYNDAQELLNAIAQNGDIALLSKAFDLIRKFWSQKPSLMFLSGVWQLGIQCWEEDKTEIAIEVTSLYRELMHGLDWYDGVRYTDLGRLVYCEARYQSTGLLLNAVEIMIQKMPELDWVAKAISYIHNFMGSKNLLNLIENHETSDASKLFDVSHASPLLLYAFGSLNEARSRFETVDCSLSSDLVAISNECIETYNLSMEIKKRSQATFVQLVPEPKNPPFIVIHRGDQYYLDCCMYQCLNVNGGQNVVLIGNLSLDTPRAFDFKPIQNYMNLANKFRKIYYHCATSPYEYELFCFQRWMILFEFMQAHELEQAVMIDSDILPFCSSSEIMDALPLPTGIGNWAWSTPVRQIDVLRQFVEFLFSIYEKSELEILDFIQNYGRIVYGSSKKSFQDMHALYAFDRLNPGLVWNMFKDAPAHGFDVNISTSDNVESQHFSLAAQKILNRPFKHCNFDSGRPIVKRCNVETKIIMKTLHFQGFTKLYMPRFISLN